MTKLAFLSFGVFWVVQNVYSLDGYNNDQSYKYNEKKTKLWNSEIRSQPAVQGYRSEIENIIT